MTQPLRIAIAGLGTVGAGVVRLLQDNAETITARTGRPLVITAVCARDKNKKRDIDCSAYKWVDRPLDLIPHADVIVELMGGAEGEARALTEAALESGRPVVSANKALIAEHGLKIAQLSERHNAPFLYESAVAGGIPVIKALREGLAGNNIHAVYGILNGTCNYILTEMRQTGRDFSAVLAEAQEKGYAEADPSFDVDGIDAAHKLSILAALAFGSQPSFKDVIVQGIRSISATDIQYATDLGYRIKLLGMARRMDDGRVVQVMEPCLLPQDSPMGAVEGVYNAVFIEGDFVGKSLMVGRGAGSEPTASAVVADLIDLARGAHVPVYGVPAASLSKPNPGVTGDLRAHFYMRMVVLDQSGVLAEIAAILRDHHISVEAVRQNARNPGQPVSIVMTTHEVAQSDVAKACAEIAKLDIIQEPPTIMRIETF